MYTGRGTIASAADVPEVLALAKTLRLKGVTAAVQGGMVVSCRKEVGRDHCGGRREEEEEETVRRAAQRNLVITKRRAAERVSREGLKRSRISLESASQSTTTVLLGNFYLRQKMSNSTFTYVSFFFFFLQPFLFLSLEELPPGGVEQAERTGPAQEVLPAQFAAHLAHLPLALLHGQLCRLHPGHQVSSVTFGSARRWDLTWQRRHLPGGFNRPSWG